jgi:hypothetical protein
MTTRGRGGAPKATPASALLTVRLWWADHVKVDRESMGFALKTDELRLGTSSRT